MHGGDLIWKPVNGVVLFVLSNIQGDSLSERAGVMSGSPLTGSRGNFRAKFKACPNNYSVIA
jgi:hypothetical protein